MSDLVASVTTPGVLVAILAMALVTYLCRVSGYFAMSLLPFTPRLRQALAALPGSIIAATVLPLVERLGPAAGIALAAALASMLIRRNEILALVVGLAVAVAARSWGP
ncbi:MAG: AzlD domain-containing protein [Hyphomicrobiales bacterium]|nr:AzlD domain-containing protein [Hyphomicrobiales bacterium]